MTISEFLKYSKPDPTPKSQLFKPTTELPFVILIHNKKFVIDLMKRSLDRGNIQLNIKIFRYSEETLYFILNNDIELKRFHIFAEYELIHEIFRDFPKIGYFLSRNGVKFFYSITKLKAYLSI